MADEPKSNANNKPKMDAFIAKVAGDPANPQETLLLTGFLGASSDANFTRVYTDITLDQYFDIANSDIVHTEPLPKEQSALGGSYIWIRKEAEAIQGAAPSERRKSRFLEGPIADQAAGFPGGTGAITPHTAPIWACYPTLVYQLCRTQYVAQCGYTHSPVACGHITVNPRCPIWQVPADPAAAAMPEAAAFAGAAPPIPPSGVAQACVTVGATVCFCPSNLPAHCPSIHGYHCPSVAGYQCPTVNSYQCPSVAGYQCPSVAGYHCPTHQYHCPSVAGYHCPSVQNYQCPPTDFGPHCNPTPNPVHCPTPNMMCPHPTGFECPSVTEICASSSPIFCAAEAGGMPQGAAGPQAAMAQPGQAIPPSVIVQQCHITANCPTRFGYCPPRTLVWYQCYTPYCPFPTRLCPI